MPPDPKVHVGVCAVVTHPGRRDEYLLLRRGGHGEYAKDGYGTWAMPGGWLDFGETPRQAAEREVMEECGIEVWAIGELGFTHNASDDGSFYVTTLFIHCSARQDDFKIMEPDKCIGMQWYQQDFIPGLPLMVATRWFFTKGPWALGSPRHQHVGHRIDTYRRGDGLTTSRCVDCSEPVALVGGLTQAVADEAEMQHWEPELLEKPAKYWRDQEHRLT